MPLLQRLMVSALIATCAVVAWPAAASSQDGGREKRAAISESNHVHASSPMVRASELIGRRVEIKTDGKTMNGEIDDLVLDLTRHCTLAALVRCDQHDGKLFVVPFSTLLATRGDREMKLEVNAPAIGSWKTVPADDAKQALSHEVVSGCAQPFGNAATWLPVPKANRLVLYKDVEGNDVHGLAGDDIADLEDVVIDANQGQIRVALIAEDGFLGFGETLHAIPASRLSYVDGVFSLAMSDSEFTNAPRFERDAFVRNQKRIAAVSNPNFTGQPTTPENEGVWMESIWNQYEFDGSPNGMATDRTSTTLPLTLPAEVVRYDVSFDSSRVDAAEVRTAEPTRDESERLTSTSTRDSRGTQTRVTEIDGSWRRQGHYEIKKATSEKDMMMLDVAVKWDGAWRDRTNRDGQSMIKKSTATAPVSSDGQPMIKKSTATAPVSSDGQPMIKKGTATASASTTRTDHRHFTARLDSNGYIQEVMGDEARSTDRFETQLALILGAGLHARTLEAGEIYRPWSAAKATTESATDPAAGRFADFALRYDGTARYGKEMVAWFTIVRENAQVANDGPTAKGAPASVVPVGHASYRLADGLLEMLAFDPVRAMIQGPRIGLGNRSYLQISRIEASAPMNGSK